MFRSNSSFFVISIIGQFYSFYPTWSWSWSWSSNTLATWCKELTHWKRPWCWERLKAGEGDDRGWDGWMASSTQWTWVWVNSGSWRWTGRPGMLQSMGSQRVGHDWVTELNWSNFIKMYHVYLKEFLIINDGEILWNLKLIINSFISPLFFILISQMFI